MANKLILTTTKSLYKPIEVEVDGKTYQCKKLTKPILDKIFSYEDEAKDGNSDAPYDQANFAFGIPFTVLHKLDAAEVGTVNRQVIDYLYSPEKAESEAAEGKNATRPGDKGSEK